MLKYCSQIQTHENKQTNESELFSVFSEKPRNDANNIKAQKA